MQPEGWRAHQEGCGDASSAETGESSSTTVPNSPLPSAVPGGESDVERAGGGDTEGGELAVARFLSPAAQWGKDITR